MTSKEQTREELDQLVTEQRNPNTLDIDTLSTLAIVKRINSEDKTVALAVEKELHHISQAVDFIVDKISSGGRLLYVGAGTSGRLGVLDAAECPPTFGTRPDMVVGVIAGGEEAMFRSIEGAEDNEEAGAGAMDSQVVGPADVVCGIAASRRTPFVVAAIARARARGAITIYITTNPRKDFRLNVDVAICPEVGPEVIMGSTRMKSGTAQKMVLNMLTTATMIRLGKVYENMMVDLQLKNAKLLERARRIIVLATGVSYDRAKEVLDLAEGHVKTAIVMLKRNLGAEEARALLNDAHGFVRAAMEGKSGA